MILLICILLRLSYDYFSLREYFTLSLIHI